MANPVSQLLFSGVLPEFTGVSLGTAIYSCSGEGALSASPDFGSAESFCADSSAQKLQGMQAEVSVAAQEYVPAKSTSFDQIVRPSIPEGEKKILAVKEEKTVLTSGNKERGSSHDSVSEKESGRAEQETIECHPEALPVPEIFGNRASTEGSPENRWQMSALFARDPSSRSGFQRVRCTNAPRDDTFQSPDYRGLSLYSARVHADVGAKEDGPANFLVPNLVKILRASLKTRGEHELSFPQSLSPHVVNGERKSLVNTGAHFKTRRGEDCPYGRWGGESSRSPIKALGDDNLNDRFSELPLSDFVPRSEQFTLPATIGDVPVRLHYVVHKGRPVFEGWEEAGRPSDEIDQGIARALWDLDPLRGFEPGIFGFVSSAGESAHKLPQYEVRGPSIGHRLAGLLIAQLQRGPDSLADSAAREAFNEYLKSDPNVPMGTAVTEDEWEDLMRKLLSYAVGHAPVFGEGGMRSINAVHEDAAAIFGIGHDTFPAILDEWENCLGFESISDRLFDDELPRNEPVRNASLQQLLLHALYSELGLRAAATLGRADAQGAMPRPDEASLQWNIARISLIDDPIEKTDSAFRLISAFARQGMVAAGRALALITSHSAISERTADGDSIAPCWSEAQLKGLIKAIMASEAWGIASHRSFRRYLTPAENAAVNSFIEYGNVGHARSMLREIDVTKVSDDEFWMAVERTGRMDFLMDHVLEELLTAASGRIRRERQTV